MLHVTGITPILWVLAHAALAMVHVAPRFWVFPNLDGMLVVEVKESDILSHWSGFWVGFFEHLDHSHFLNDFIYYLRG